MAAPGGLNAPLPWHDQWRSGDELDIRVQAAPVGTPPRRTHRILTGSPARSGERGVVIVAVTGGEDPSVLFVRQPRPAVERRLWELPRGAIDAGDAGACEAGARELREETGFVAGEAAAIGRLYPDSGILGTAVAVVTTAVDPSAVTGRTDGEVDSVAWWPASTIAAAIAEGRLQDGISLAALTVAAARGVLDWLAG